MSWSDEDLFERYRGGDEAGFEELVARYRGPLFTVVFRMVGDRAQAQDIFQETFCRIMRHRDRFDATARFSPWIYSIATNLARDHLRRRLRSPLVMAAEPPDGVCEGDPESEAMEGEMRRAIDAALQSLPEDQREVFLLREHGGLSFKEIAQLTDSNLNTVLGRMHLAMKKLKERLRPLMEVES